MMFREMNESDLAQVLTVERNAYSHPWTEGNFKDSLVGSDEIWLLELEGEVVGHGVISAAVGEAHLLNICVARQHHRKGLGRAILEFVIERAKQLGATVMFLEVRESNTSAIALYLAEGFRTIGSRKNYYPFGSEREHAVVMSLSID